MTPLRCCSSSTPASAARLFVQLSCTRRSSSTYAIPPSPSSSPSGSILDVLLPPPPPPPTPAPVPRPTRPFHHDNSAPESHRRGLRTRHHSAAAAAATKLGRGTHTISNSSRSHAVFSSSSPSSVLSSQPPRSRRYHGHHQCAAPFSTTAARRKTQVLHNPQVDDDGKEMIMEITPRAANVCYAFPVPLPNRACSLYMQ